MNIRFVSQDLQWTASMKENVQAKIVEPLRRRLASQDFELSVHLGLERKRVQARKPKFEMWVVLQTFGTCGNQVVRCQGDDFVALTNEVSHHMRLKVSKAQERRRFSINPLRFLPIECSA